MARFWDGDQYGETRLIFGHNSDGAEYKAAVENSGSRPVPGESLIITSSHNGRWNASRVHIRSRAAASRP